MKAKIEIERLEVEFFNSLRLHQLYVEDQEQDTLLAVEELQFSLYKLSFETNYIGGATSLNGVHFNLYRKAEQKHFNSQFLLDYFGSSDSSSSENWGVDISSVSLTNASFHYHDYHKADTLKGVNYDHVDVYDLKLLAQDFELIDKELAVQVDSLSFKEANGFELEQLSTAFNQSPELLDFQELQIITQKTNLEGSVRLSANSFSDYSDFTEKVHLSTVFKQTTLSTSDLAYFVPLFQHIKETVKLEGKVYGTVSNLSGEELRVQLNPQTYFLGDFDLRGLPDVEETFVYLDLKEFATTASGLRALPYPPFNEKNHLKVPKNIDKMGIIYFRGNFSGYFNDFVAYGKLNSQLGGLKTDLAVSENDRGIFKYKGSVQSKKFELGDFLELKNLGSLGLNLKVEGEGIEKETLKAKAKGTVTNLKYIDYTYEDISLDGRLRNGKFTGDLSINDPNLVLDFEGTIQQEDNRIDTDFLLDVKHSNLVKLKLIKRQDTLSNLAFRANFDVNFSSIDNLEGVAEIDSLHYLDSDYQLADKSLNLTALNQEENKKLQLSSSFLDATLEGDFSINKLAESMVDFTNHYLGIPPQNKAELSQDFKLHVKFKKSQKLANIMVPGLKLDTALDLALRLNTVNQSGSLEFKGGYFGYEGQLLEEFNLQLQAGADSIHQELSASQITLGRVNELDTAYLQSSLYKGQLLSFLKWKSDTKVLDRGELKLKGEIESVDSMNLSLFESYVSIRDSVWHFDSNNVVQIRPKRVVVENFRLQNENQVLAVEGVLSDRKSDSMHVNLEQLDLTYLTLLLPKDVARMKGIAQGDLIVSQAYTEPSIVADVSISALELNQVYMGNTTFKSTWNSNKEALEIDGYFGEGKEEKLDVSGMFFPTREEESLDLEVTFNKFPLPILEPYLKDYLSNWEGAIEGSVSVKGNPTKPLARGDLYLKQAGLTVNYLNTHYRINDKIKLRPDFIGFDLIKIKDEEGNQAVATGTIFHENYQDLNLDVSLEFENFKALNTKSKDNDLFYGTAISSGTANISGYADQLIMTITATAEKGTDFSIPLEEGVEVSNSDFLIFTNSPQSDQDARDAIDLSGIQMNFDLDIKPEAKVKIIFDEQIGDILEAKGQGNLKLEINTLGNFNIYGQYVIEEGEYLFTLKNLISKKFELEKGSRISWDGDPYRARIDMKAIYNLRAPLADIMPEDSLTNYKRRSPVELELHMTSYLLSPEISFDIRLPNANEATRQRLRSVLYVNQNDVNEQEMNQQVFGLLFLNRFLPPSTGNSSASGSRGAPGINNGYEMLSNQMSNWLSKLSDQFDVGVNYRQGNEYTGDEFDLSLSTELFQDRLVLDGNVGYSSNNQIQNNNQSNFVGEFTVEYKLSKDGRFRVSAFNRSVNNSLLQTVSPYTQGVGLFYREEFDTFNELWRRYFSKDSKATKQDS
ncbi:MAG: translocation/assembly module TamB domain-containing protein [Vicingaceae bacterium]